MRRQASVRIATPVVFAILSLAGSAAAQTQVTSIVANPATFSPQAGQNTTVTVSATAGVSNLQLHVLKSSGSIVRSGLALNEVAAGVYTTIWNGRDNGSQVVLPAQFSLRVFNAATTTYLAGLVATVDVTGPVTSVAASPNPFVPTGSNSTTITVDGTPGEAGLTVGFNGSCDQRLPLVETTPGRYTAAWTAVGRQFSGVCAPMRIYSNSTQTIEVHDGAGQLVHNVSTVQVAGVSQVTRAPDRFAPSAGGTTTITVTAVAGMNLEARFVSNQTNAVARVLPLSGVGTTSSGLWDGRDAVGALAPVATYRVLIFSVAGPHHYAPETSVRLRSA